MVFVSFFCKTHIIFSRLRSFDDGVFGSYFWLKVKTLDEVMKRSAADTTPPASARATRQVAPSQRDLSASRFYCSYCDQDFSQEWQLQHHSLSASHRSRVNSDKEREWRHRSPPWSIVNGDYMLCKE